MIGVRIARMEKFLKKQGYKAKQNKGENSIEYSERLYELIQQWEEDNQQEANY